MHVGVTCVGKYCQWGPACPAESRSLVMELAVRPAGILLWCPMLACHRPSPADSHAMPPYQFNRICTRPHCIKHSLSPRICSFHSQPYDHSQSGVAISSPEFVPFPLTVSRIHTSPQWAPLATSAGSKLRLRSEHTYSALSQLSVCAIHISADQMADLVEAVSFLDMIPATSTVYSAWPSSRSSSATPSRLRMTRLSTTSTPGKRVSFTAETPSEPTNNLQV